MRNRSPQCLILVAVAIGGAGGCARFPFGSAGLDDRECLTRAMYFESNRSSEDGMLAVGTTVMNRLQSPKFPKTVCGVVGQPNQYAPGVLTNPMVPRLRQRVERVADAVLAGQRHPQVGGAMFFHTVGYSFPYTNMHYVAVAGGNAFYEKTPWSAPQRFSRTGQVNPPTTLFATISGFLRSSDSHPKGRRTHYATANNSDLMRN